MCRSRFLNSTKIWEWRDLLRLSIGWLVESLLELSQHRSQPTWRVVRSFDFTLIAKLLLNATCFLLQSMTLRHFEGTFKRTEFFSSNFAASLQDAITKQDMHTNCLPSQVCKMQRFSGTIPIFFLFLFFLFKVAILCLLSSSALLIPQNDSPHTQLLQ